MYYKVMSYLSFKLTDIYVSLSDKILKFYHHSLECLLFQLQRSNKKTLGRIILNTHGLVKEYMYIEIEMI